MDGLTPPEDGDHQEDDGKRRERRRFIRQLLIDWSPVLANVVATLALRHPS
ncbi:hypothetical protein [Streptomyces sp. NPDC094468]|uniref:hypothetical protein n=1 Tax=Streptomyces sp. NPDC094468 TaxID=3366066 RepID=UPI0038154F45